MSAADTEGSLPSSSGTEGRRPVYDLVVPLDGLARLGAVVVATVLVVVALDQAQPVVGLIAVALVCAVTLAPLVDRLAQRIRFAPALLVVHVLGLLTFGTLAGVVSTDLDRQSSHLEDGLHRALDDLQPGSWPAALAEDLDAHGRLQRVFENLAARTFAGEGAVPAVLHRVGQAILVTVLSAFLVAGRERIVAGITSLSASKSRRRIVRSTMSGAASTAGRYLRRTITVGVAHGCVVAAVTAGWGLPGGLSLGAWAALISVVPILGGVVAWAPTIILASTELSRWGTAALVVVAIGAVVLDRLARRRLVEAATVRVGPMVSGVALALGVAAGGPAGALVALFAAVALAAVVVCHDTAVTSALADYAQDGPGPETHTPVVAGMAHDGRRPTVSVRISWRTALLVGTMAVTLAALRLGLTRAGATLVWVVVGLIVSIGLDRPVSWVQHRTRWPRPLVVAFLALAAGATVLSLAALSAPQATRSSTSLVEDAPEVVRSLQDLPLIGSRLEDADAARRVEDAIGDLPDRVARSGMVDRIGSLAGDGLVGAFWTLVIVAATLLDGPRVVGRAAAELPARYRRQCVRLGRAGQSAIARYAAGSAFVAVLNGLVVGIGAFLLGVPMAPALAAWAMAWNFVPQIGGFVGGVPFVALAFSQSPITGVVAFIGFVTYQNIENHLIQPAVIGRSVDLPPWLALVAALVGAAIGGLVGAVLAVPLLGVVKVMHREWQREDFPGAVVSVPRRDRPAASAPPVLVGGERWN